MKCVNLKVLMRYLLLEFLNLCIQTLNLVLGVNQLLCLLLSVESTYTRISVYNTDRLNYWMTNILPTPVYQLVIF